MLGQIAAIFEIPMMRMKFENENSEIVRFKILLNELINRT